ncbi:MAG TPA: tetratricopeptide repeat protein [Armatimonadetes bacterium]|nr:tetratricopeptide repeat protein [Armatimonadota bacterium]
MEQLLEEAFELLRQHRPAEAVARLQRVLLADPENFEALHYMGIARGKQGLLDEAENFLRRALAIRPNHALARYHLGYVLYRKGNLGEARWNLEEALRLDPSLEGARRLLAEISDLRAGENLANFWARAASATIDLAVLSLLSLALVLPVLVPVAIEGFESAPKGSTLEWEALGVGLTPLALVYVRAVQFGLSVLVYALPWAMWGRSPGMVALGLRFTDASGRRPARWRVLVRWLVYHGYYGAIVPAPLLGPLGAALDALFFVAGVGLFLANVVLISSTPKRQAVHDLVAGTFVVGGGLPAWLSLLIVVGVGLALTGVAGIVALASILLSLGR